MKRWKWDIKKNKETLSFLKKFIVLLAAKKFQVVHFGWWPAGKRGYYGLSLWWKNLDETESEK